MINIYPIFYNKKQYLDLLLLADEQESMIDRYLKRGDMFVLAENNVWLRVWAETKVRSR